MTGKSIVSFPTQERWLTRPWALVAMALLIFVPITQPAPSDASQVIRQPDGILVTEFEGILLAAVPPNPNKDFKLPITPINEGLSKLQSALRELSGLGGAAKEALDRLRRAGQLEIFYDPNFPPSEGSSLTLGAFFPEFFDPIQNKRRLVTAISRFGIKWSHEELVAILAHELLGHGIQHLNGELDRVRRIDLECGAELYREAVYQGLGINKRDSRIVKFRKTLEGHWCRPFKDYQRRTAPDTLAYWQKLNPDVKPLLLTLKQFYQHQIETGDGSKAVALDRDIMLRRSIEDTRRREGEKAGTVLFNDAIRYRDGIDLRRDLEKAIILFEAAAESGHPTAAIEAQKLKTAQ